MSRDRISLAQLQDLGLERLVVACDRCHPHGVCKVARLPATPAADRAAGSAKGG
jgi:hypothetical protein